jgi:hypothetical protein
MFLFLCVCLAKCVCVGACLCVCVRARVRVALLIQHATRMRHILLSFVVSPSLHKIFGIVTNGMVFGKMLLNIKCLF